MKTYKGGDEARGGFYWNTRNWAITLNRRDGETLPGDGEDRFVRIPTLALVIVGPAVGGLFAMFLPFIGFALVGYHGARKLAMLTAGAAHGLAATLVPAWRPGEAYLAGGPVHRKDEAATARPATDGKLETLQKEIEARRKA